MIGKPSIANANRAIPHYAFVLRGVADLEESVKARPTLRKWFRKEPLSRRTARVTPYAHLDKPLLSQVSVKRAVAIPRAVGFELAHISDRATRTEALRAHEEVELAYLNANAGLAAPMILIGSHFEKSDKDGWIIAPD